MTRPAARPTVLLLATACLAAGPSTLPSTAPTAFAEHGVAAMDLIAGRMALPDRHLYVQEVRPADPAFRPVAADCWSVGVQLTALTAAARVDRDLYRPAVRQYVEAINANYWSDANGIGGFDDGPHPKPPDRYYDDNAWVALGLVEAYEVTRDPADLDRAAATLAFVLSGEDAKLGGGLYWRERVRASKNTCTNAPAIAAAVRVYTYTHDRTQLDAALRLYRWTTARLRDLDGLYFDNLGLDGKLHGHKWTYNTALMIRSGCLLYDATGDGAFLHDAQRSASAAVTAWVDPASGAIKDPSYFAHLLAEAFLEVTARDHDPRWAAVDHRALAFVWDHVRDPSGLYPERWDRSPRRPLRVARLINQASAARAFFRAAWPDPAPMKQR